MQSAFLKVAKKHFIMKYIELGGMQVADKEREKVHTSTLMRKLCKTKMLSAFLQQNETHLERESFQDCLKKRCAEKNEIAEHVIERAQIDRTYGHQLFNGTRNPSRDKVLQLAVGLGLSVDETQNLLRAASKSPLYPRIRRDAVLIFALKEHWKMADVQEALDQYELTLLGGDSKDG